MSGLTLTLNFSLEGKRYDTDYPWHIRLMRGVLLYSNYHTLGDLSIRARGGQNLFLNHATNHNYRLKPLALTGSEFYSRFPTLVPSPLCLYRY